MDTSDISRLFPSLLNDIFKEGTKDYTNLVEIFKKYLVNKNKGNSMEMPDDVKLEQNIMFANMYNYRITVKMVFDKIELYGNSAPVDLSSLSIEHLMPQTPTSEWYEALGVNEDEYQRNLHRLGNLTLATKVDNSKMKNKVWQYKNAILTTTSHLKINEEILKKEKWLIEDIDIRTKQLIRKIKEIYPYFEASGDVVTKYPIYIDSSGIMATGKLYEADGSVEIDEGSMLNINFENSSNYLEVEELRQELISDGVIGETESGLCFLRNYIFYPRSANATALSSTASLLLHGSRNGWEYWMFESGQPVKSNKLLKNKFS